MLYKVVDESIFEKIFGASTSKEAWDVVKKVFKCQPSYTCSNTTSSVGGHADEGFRKCI